MIQTPEQFAHTSYLKKSGQSAVQATCSLIKYSDTTLQTSRMFTGHWTSAVTGMPVNATNTQHTGLQDRILFKNCLATHFLLTILQHETICYLCIVTPLQ